MTHTEKQWVSTSRNMRWARVSSIKFISKFKSVTNTSNSDNKVDDLDWLNAYVVRVATAQLQICSKIHVIDHLQASGPVEPMLLPQWSTYWLFFTKRFKNRHDGPILLLQPLIWELDSLAHCSFTLVVHLYVWLCPANNSTPGYKWHTSR